MLCKGELKDIKSTEIEVPVKTPQGRVEIRKRHLIQLGTSQIKVEYKSTAKNIGDIAEDTVLINIVAHKAWLSPPHWKALITEPVPAVRRFLRFRVGAQAIDVFGPKRDPERPDLFQIKARIAKAQLSHAMGKSGTDNINIWDLGKVQEYKTVYLPAGSDGAAARRQADRISYSMGVVNNAKRVGVRVPANMFCHATETILGKEEAERISSGKWELSNMPAAYGKSAVEKALSSFGWVDFALEERPRYIKAQDRRSWTVRSNEEPPGNSLQHTLGLAVINRITGDTKPKKSLEDRPPPLVWKRPEGKRAP